MKKAGKWSQEEQLVLSHLLYTQVKCVTENVGISQWVGVILGSVQDHAMDTQTCYFSTKEKENVELGHNDQ